MLDTENELCNLAGHCHFSSAHYTLPTKAKKCKSNPPQVHLKLELNPYSGTSKGINVTKTILWLCKDQKPRIHPSSPHHSHPTSQQVTLLSSDSFNINLSH